MRTQKELYSFLLNHHCISTVKHSDDLSEGDWYKDLPTVIQCQRDVVMTIITNTIYAYWESESFNKLCEIFKAHFSNDKDFIRQYLSETSYENEFFVRASKEIQMDYELLTQYLKLGHPESDNYFNFCAVHDEVKRNRVLMLRLIHDMPGTFIEFTDEFKDDSEIASIALKQDGLLLKFASDRIRSDVDLVKIAIENNMKAVMFANKKLREFPDGLFYEEYWKVTNGVI